MKDLQIGDNKELTNINVFKENNTFKELEELQLNGNKIEDIEAISNSKMEKLKLLNLSNNNIKDISSLKDAVFRNLETLHLFNNQIKSIAVMDNIPFKASIKDLDLSYNAIDSINDIEILIKKENFGNLKELKIEGNANLDYQNKKIQELLLKLFILLEQKLLINSFSNSINKSSSSNSCS